MKLKLDQITFIIVTYKSESIIYNCLNSLPNESKKIIIENSSNINLENELNDLAEETSGTPMREARNVMFESVPGGGSDLASGNLDDFSHASTELSHLQWIDLNLINELELPFITEIVLAEVASREERGRHPEGIPFFDYSKENSQISFIKA